MGCCGSKKVMVRGVPAEAYFLKIVKPDVAEYLDLIGFTDVEAVRLFKTFTSIDEDLNHDVSLKEFYKHYKIKKTMFADRVFGVLDRDGSGELSFKEFMLGIWNFCTLDSQNLIRFAFDMYDLDGRGFLTMGQCSSLLRMLYNTKNISSRLRKILEGADEDGDGEFSMEEWHNLSENYPELMQPAKDAQLIIRKKTFGLRFWAKKTQFRNDTYKLQNVFRILETHDREREKEEKEQAEAEEMAAKEQAEAEEARRIAEEEAAKAEEDRIWNSITRVEQEEQEGKKECDRLKAVADEIYEAAPYKGDPMVALNDPALCCALAELEEALIETVPRIEQAFENRLARETKRVQVETRIEVEDFYATKKGRKMLKSQVADKKKNSHMYSKKEMKREFVQREYLAVKTENNLKEVREKLVADFRDDLDKYEDMLDMLLMAYDVDDSEVNEDVWERHFDTSCSKFVWHCPITGVSIFTVPVKGQEDPDYDDMLPFRKYHKDDIYARMAQQAADAFSDYTGMDEMSAMGADEVMEGKGYDGEPAEGVGTGAGAGAGAGAGGKYMTDRDLGIVDGEAYVKGREPASLQSTAAKGAA